MNDQQKLLIPDWLVVLVGRLTIQNEALQAELTAQQREEPDADAHS